MRSMKQGIMSAIVRVEEKVQSQQQQLNSIVNLLQNQQRTPSRAPAPAVDGSRDWSTRKESPNVRLLNDGMVELGGEQHKVRVKHTDYTKAWSTTPDPIKFFLALLSKVISDNTLSNALMYGRVASVNAAGQITAHSRVSLYATSQFQALLAQTERVFPGCLTADFLRKLQTKVNDKCRAIRNKQKRADPGNNQW